MSSTQRTTQPTSNDCRMLVASRVALDDSEANSSVLAINRSSDAAEMCTGLGAFGLSFTADVSALRTSIGLGFDLVILEVLQGAGMVGHVVLAIHRIEGEVVQRRRHCDHVGFVLRHGVDDFFDDIVL